jgi:phosphohistidine swiveling domain-containing protein
MTLEEKWPPVYKELIEVKDVLETHFKDVCDFEFTVENGRLFILGIRIARRTSRADLKFSIDFFKEGKIDLNEALSRIHTFDINNIFKPEIFNSSELRSIGKGLPASNGAATGVIVFNENSGYELLKKNYPIIYVKDEVNPEDIDIMTKSKGILTFRGGMTSHAAVISRGIGIPCVSGCADLTIKGNYLKGRNIPLLKIGDFITIDGNNGNVYEGKANITNKNWRNDEELVGISKMIELSIRFNNIAISNIGHCWAIRDFFLHNLPLESNNAFKKPICNLNKYMSFSQPKKETIDDYWNGIYNLPLEDNENYKYILNGIRKTFLRILSNKVGIGNHFKYFRPLFDPTLSIQNKDNRPFKQLIGEEYFHINKYIHHLIDIYNIKIFLEIEADSENELWFLDNTNIKGENIVDRGDNITGYKIFVNEALVSHEDVPVFYNSLRKREYYWKWFQNNRTNYTEIVSFLKKDEGERSTNFRLNTYAHELGLLNNNKLTISGMSLVSL